jgi:hypothetical protein
MSEWDGYILKDYRIHFDPAALVLDVGCGQGDQMKGAKGYLSCALMPSRFRSKIPSLTAFCAKSCFRTRAKSRSYASLDACSNREEDVICNVTALVTT